MSYQVHYTDFVGTIVADLLVTLDTDGGVATGISGTRNGETVTGLTSFAGSDNTLSATAPFVSFNGLSYSVTSGENFNLFSLSSFNFEVRSSDQMMIAIVDLRVVPVTPVPPQPPVPPDPPVPVPSGVPEPSSWALMIGGFGMIGGAMRRLRQPATA